MNRELNLIEMNIYFICNLSKDRYNSPKLVIIFLIKMDDELFMNDG